MKINIEKITIEIDDEHVRTVLLSVLPKMGIKDVNINTSEIEATRQLEAIDEVEHDLEEKVDQMEHDIDKRLHEIENLSQNNSETIESGEKK